MISGTTAQRRKGGAPKSLEGAGTLKYVQAVNQTSTPVATVKRNKFGTGPFDENWLNVDCCGLFCALITYGLHVYGVYAVCMVLLPPWMSTTDDNGYRSLTVMGHIHRLVFTMVAALAIASHFKAMTTDPGAVPPDAVPLEETAQQDEEMNGTQEGVEPSPPPARKGCRICRRCNAFKPPRAHHCSVCRRCIIKMDRKSLSCLCPKKCVAPPECRGTDFAVPLNIFFADHCPWVNNCVGIGNHKYFLLFVFYTFVSCIYSLGLVITRFVGCMHRYSHLRSHHHGMTCLDRPTQILSVLGLIVEAILFGMFTACMMIDQASVVTSKMTHIDRLKGGDDELGGSTLAGVIEVFGLRGVGGNRFRPDWLSPFAKICFPPSLHDEIMGFCRPCVGNRNNGGQETEMSGSMRTGTSQMVRSVTEIV